MSHSRQARKQMLQLCSTDVTQGTAIMWMDEWMDSIYAGKKDEIVETGVTRIMKEML